MTLTHVRVWLAVATIGAFAGGAAATAATPPPTMDAFGVRQVKEIAKDVKDFWIKMKIHSQFALEDSLEGSNIDVDITRGAVTLNGVVTSSAARTKAASIAKETDGVKTVTNNLKVGPAETAIDPQKIREAGRNVGRIITDGWVKSTIYAIENLKIGGTAPEIAANDLDGVPFKLSDYRGKAVLLDFWGYW